MSTCLYCQAANPLDALCCVHCGRTLVIETLQDRSTQERLRDLLEAKGLLVGGLTPPPPSPPSPLSEGPPPVVAPVLRSGGAGSQILSLPTDRDRPLFTLPFEVTPSGIPGPTPGSTPAPALATAPTVDDCETASAPTPLVADAGMPAAKGHPDRMPQPGDVIELYEITSEIGRGGMGRVYFAHHRLTGQEVALKMLLPQFSNEPRLRARFLNEAKVLARLEHPNLVPLLGFFESGSRAFIVMPYVRGITLERMLRRQGRLSLEIVVDLFEQLCAAIGHVHRHDFLHRDLKPSNVIVRGDGRVMVTDFGIARAIGAEKMTLPGMVVGTAEYLAPEQACGASRDDKRSDIYSLGILLYEMLTGQVPFHHPNAGEVLQRQVSGQPPPPRAIAPEITPALESVMLRALAKDPDKRFQSAQEFANVVRTTVWPTPGTEDIVRHEACESVSPAPSVRGRGVDWSVAPSEVAPTLDAPDPGRAATPPLREWLRWGMVVLGLACAGAVVGAWLRLRG